ncbi:MAG: type IV toxin-antitoxin system AbiEi family antitoxin domain-containing protein [Pseudolysinimonas sp.]|uniref:endonuclease domain-containing protein n=1 Tax=Pseudolysinimonas sp. TaxID=2680009 RepID=UPI0032651774
MFSAASVVRAFGGIATRQQLIDAGLSGTDLTAGVRRGEIRRVRRAHYATPNAPRAAVDAVRVGGRLCGLSAAGTYGIWAGFGTVVHVAIPRNASRLRVIRADGGVTPDISERPIRLHWIDAEPNRECWRVSLADSLRASVSWSDHETAMACLDTAIDGAGLTSHALRAIFERESLASRLRAAAARSGCGSGYESIVVRRLERLGLPIRQQVVISGVGRVDALIGRSLVVEIDGVETHFTREAFEADRLRDATIVARGGAVIRLSTRRIREDWNGCAAEILAAFRFQESMGAAGPELAAATSEVDFRHIRNRNS